MSGHLPRASAAPEALELDERIAMAGRPRHSVDPPGLQRHQRQAGAHAAGASSKDGPSWSLPRKINSRAY
jgi:hypothetical protein